MFHYVVNCDVLLLIRALPNLADDELSGAAR